MTAVAFVLASAVSAYNVRTAVPHRCTSARSTRPACSVPSDDHEDRSRLEYLFSLRAPEPIAKPVEQQRQEQQPSAEHVDQPPGVLLDVPLFRPEWTALPGFTHGMLQRFQTLAIRFDAR